MTRPGPFDADLTARTQRPAHKETTMGTDGLREQLAEALDAADNWNPDPTLTGIEFWDHYADALLPVVESYAAQKAAEELRAAADEAIDSGYILRLDSGLMFDVLTAEQLNARADSLSAPTSPATSPGSQRHPDGGGNGSQTDWRHGMTHGEQTTTEGKRWN